MSLRFRLTAISVLLVALGCSAPASRPATTSTPSWSTASTSSSDRRRCPRCTRWATETPAPARNLANSLPSGSYVALVTPQGGAVSVRYVGTGNASDARFPRLGAHRHLDDRRLPRAGRRRGVGGPTGLDRVGIGHAGDRDPARRRPQHRAAADDDRAAGRRDRAGGRGCARADPGAGRPAPAGPDRADGRGDRRRRPLAARREQRSAHRGRPPGRGAQRDAGADRARVRRAASGRRIACAGSSPMPRTSCGRR